MKQRFRFFVIAFLVLFACSTEDRSLVITNDEINLKSERRISVVERTETTGKQIYFITFLT
jgi:hypothetical protein